MTSGIPQGGVRLSEITAYMPTWITPEMMIQAAAAIILFSLLYNIILYSRMKHTILKLALQAALIKKLQGDFRVEKTKAMKSENKVEVLSNYIAEQETLLDKAPLTEEIRKARELIEEKYNKDTLRKGYWKRIETMGIPTENPSIQKLMEEMNEIRGMLEITKIKYHTRAIDEKSFSNITQEYQKRLIELETKMRKLHGEYDIEEKPQSQETRTQEQDLRGKVENNIPPQDNAVVLISSKSENHARVVTATLDTLINKRGMGGVYISVSRPSDAIIATMQSAGIASDDIQFIDCISQMTGKIRPERQENIVYVENPSSLEEVSMYLDKVMAKVDNKRRFIIMDSLSSLLIYNNEKSVKEFAHFIINRIRLEKTTGVILSIEKKEAEELVKTLAPMCDAEIRI